MPRTKGKLTKINIKPLQSQITTYGCSCNTLHIIIVVLVVTIIQGCLLGDMAIFFSHNDQLSECTCTPWYDNRPLQLVCFVFLIEVLGELEPLSFHKLCVHMPVNKKKFERNTSSLGYYMYHVIWFGKTKHTSLRGLLAAIDQQFQSSTSKAQGNFTYRNLFYCS